MDCWKKFYRRNGILSHEESKLSFVSFHLNTNYFCRVVRSLGIFSLYYVFFFTAYMERPFSMATEVDYLFILSPLTISKYHNFSWRQKEQLMDRVETSRMLRITVSIVFDKEMSDLFRWFPCSLSSHLLQWASIRTRMGTFPLPYFPNKPYFLQLRLGCEIAVITLIAIQIVFDVRDVRQIGWGKWITVYVRWPSLIYMKRFVTESIPCESYLQNYLVKYCLRKSESLLYLGVSFFFQFLFELFALSIEISSSSRIIWFLQQ